MTISKCYITWFVLDVFPEPYKFGWYDRPRRAHEKVGID